MHLVQTAYHSRSRLGSDHRVMLQGLRDILSIARDRNGATGVTGYLLYDRDLFAQVLEGPRAAVEAVMKSIRADKRHDTVLVLGHRPVLTRDFGAWSMGGGTRSIEQQEVYLRHGFSQALDPIRLSLPKLVALAGDLARLESQRRKIMA